MGTVRPWHSFSNFLSHLRCDSGFFGGLRPDPGGRQAAPLVQQPRPLPLRAPSSVLLLSDGGGRVEKQTATLQALLLLVVVVVGLLLRSSPFQRPLELFPASEAGTMSETCRSWIVRCEGKNEREQESGVNEKHMEYACREGGRGCGANGGDEGGVVLQLPYTLKNSSEILVCWWAPSH